MYFFIEYVCTDIQILQKYVSEGQIDDKSAPVWVMAWCRKWHYLNH